MAEVMGVEVNHPDWPDDGVPVEVIQGEMGLEIRIPSHEDWETRTTFRPLFLFVDYVQRQVEAGVSRGREGA